MLTSPYPQPALLGTRQKRGQVSALVVSGVCAVIAVLSATGVLGAFSTIAYVMLGVFASASVIAGIFRFHPRRSWPWVAIATALLLFIVSLGLRVSYQTLGDLTPNRSLAPDYLALPGYLLLGLGLSGLVWARCGKSEGFTDTMLDAIIAGLAAMTLAWAFLIGPALANTHVSPLVKLTLSVYPPMSVMLLTLSVQLAFSGDGRTSRPAFLGAISAMGFMLVGDIIYNLADLRIATAPDWAIGLPYGMAFASIVYLAWHPTFREFSEPAAAADTQVGRFRLAIVGVALAVPAVVVSFETTVSVNDRVILGVIIVTLSCVAIARILRVIRRQADMQRLLLDQVSHDQLTGLPNRSLVMNQLARRIDRLERERGTIGLLFFDLDRFKLVNDAYGHGYGDDLLRAVADRLAGADLGADVVARIGGDEFVVLVGENATLAAVADTAERVRALMLQPIPVRELELGVSVSIGVAFVDQDGVDVTPESMLRDADTAMYRAKDAGRDSVVIFDSSMRERVARRLELETALRVALPNNELIVYYQPIVALPSGRIRGFEALLRWRHPVMGMVSPAEFIPIAEETGGIVEIGAFVLESALGYFGQLIRDLDAPGLTMSVNLSGRQLFTPGLVGWVGELLRRNQIPTDALHLEVTESVLLDDPDGADEVLTALRGLGVALSCDDFGTGYSSLAYLKRFPFDVVKIDRAFVDGLDRTESSQKSLIRAIVAMADALGLDTVAEGVETPSEADALVPLGCRSAQGFLFGHAVPPQEVLETILRLGLAGRDQMEPGRITSG
jgi:diguanylate cyclase